MIPKIIHYCWFGGSEMPEEFRHYLSEWRNLHPDWVIKKWDESNFLTENGYMKMAISNRNWANASNYARLEVLEKEGGIYMDVDFKVIKPLDELLLDDFFVAFESQSEAGFWINNAIMGA